MRGYVTCKYCKGKGTIIKWLVIHRSCKYCNGFGSIWVDNIDDYFDRIEKTLKLKNMRQNNFSDDQEMKYILRQIGFGAILGTAFLCVLYLGGLVAQCASNF